MRAEEQWKYSSAFNIASIIFSLFSIDFRLVVIVVRKKMKMKKNKINSIWGNGECKQQQRNPRSIYYQLCNIIGIILV